MNISISEINSYLTCRRAWDLTSANRQSLKHKVTPKMFFVVGSAIHEAIDAQARGDDPFEFFEEYVSRERADRKAAYEEIVGSTPWFGEMEEFESSVNLARLLVEQYFSHYSAENPLADQGLKYVATEVPFSIPLLDGNVNFVGTIDGVATDIETESLFYLVENKTSAQRPDLESVESGNQWVGYNWAFRALTGVTPAGTLYNGVIKNPIKSPRVLKDGSLSMDKSARVTLKTFTEALARGNYDPVKYYDYLAFLEERERNGDDRFFVREMFHYSNQQLNHWFYSVLLPMAYELQESHDVPVPNFSACKNCLVKDICKSMQLGESTEALIEQRYEVKTYGTMEAVTGVTPTTVSSAEELINLLRER
jgi:hypothetical protein